MVNIFEESRCICGAIVAFALIIGCFAFRKDLKKIVCGSDETQEKEPKSDVEDTIEEQKETKEEDTNQELKKVEMPRPRRYARRNRD